MPTVTTNVNLQYSYTIGRGEQFGPGFTSPVFVARGEDCSIVEMQGHVNGLQKNLDTLKKIQGALGGGK